MNNSGGRNGGKSRSINQAALLVLSGSEAIVYGDKKHIECYCCAPTKGNKLDPWHWLPQSLGGAESKPEYKHVYTQELSIMPGIAPGFLTAM